MPTLYSAQVPAGYNTANTGKVSWEQAATKATKVHSWLPYIVSGPLSDGYRVVGTIGALVHVLFWVLSLVMDGLLVSRMEGGSPGQNDGLNYSIFSLVFTLIGFVTLLVIVITHVATSGIKDGACLPSPSPSVALVLAPADRAPRHIPQAASRPSCSRS